MIRILSLLLLLSALEASLFAQSPQEPEKKVYKSENEKLYINKDLGIYLWISTSPDPDSEKIRLKSESSETYSNPMYLDTEGYNTVRSPSAVDTVSRKTVYPLQDIIFEVYADGQPPVSRSKYSYKSTRMLSGKRFYNGEVKIELSARDEVSGPDNIFYCLNDKDFSTYSNVLTQVKEGENTLKFYSTDHVGNAGKITEEIFYLDNTPPKTDYEILGEQNEKFVSASAMIKLESKDDLSGVRAIYYKLNNGQFLPYSSPIPAKILSDEQAVISFYAVDHIGNKEAVQSIGSSEGIKVEGEETPNDFVFEFYIDREPPEVKLGIDSTGKSYKGNYTYISPHTKLIITANDKKAGVKDISYSINSSALDTKYSAPFGLTKQGLQYVHVSATDYVGNKSASLVKAFFNDAEPPATSLVISSPKFKSRDTLFVNAKTRFMLSATDANSGVRNIQFGINSEDLMSYEEPISLQTNGLTKVTYCATDNVGNREEAETIEVFVDNQPPKIHYHYSVESIGSKVVRDENYTIYPTHVMLYIAATDTYSGGEKIEYTINGGKVLTANPIKGLRPGNYLIEVFAFDVLGNKSKETIKFAVEE